MTFSGLNSIKCEASVWHDINWRDGEGRKNTFGENLISAKAKAKAF